MAQKKVRKGKKRWYSIRAPKVFNNQVLGETYIYETEQLEDKHLTVNLMALTGNPKKQNMNIFFAVTGVEDNVASTKTTGMEMQPSSIKRLARRGRTKIADSFLTRTKKGQLVRAKPIAVTRTRADRETQSAIRKRARELLSETLKKYSFDTVINDVVNMKLQRHLKDQLSAIFPVRSVDIRYLAYAKADSEEEGDIESSEYEERPKRERAPKAEEQPEGLASLREELDEALAAEKEDVEPNPTASKKAKKPAKKAASDDEDDDSEEE